MPVIAVRIFYFAVRTRPGIRGEFRTYEAGFRCCRVHFGISVTGKIFSILYKFRELITELIKLRPHYATYTNTNRPSQENLMLKCLCRQLFWLSGILSENARPKVLPRQ